LWEDKLDQAMARCVWTGSPPGIRQQSVSGNLPSGRRVEPLDELVRLGQVAGHLGARLGLFASFTMAVTIAFVGGRPAMISEATGAIAPVVAPLVKSHGVDYFIAAVILAGIFQIVLGVSGVAKLMRFIPRFVMVGFVNAPGHPYFHVPGSRTDQCSVAGLSPRCVGACDRVRPTEADPGSAGPAGRHRRADTQHDPCLRGCPDRGRQGRPARIIDDVTDTRSHKSREAWGQGVANIVTGFTGGMGGCAMIGQTMINVKASGARTRISTFLAGVFLLILVVALGDLVSVIPMAALVAVMIFVCWATFDWHSIRPRTLKMMPKSETRS
jgi:SulP family sulfate permease